MNRPLTPALCRLAEERQDRRQSLAKGRFIIPRRVKIVHAPLRLEQLAPWPLPRWPAAAGARETYTPCAIAERPGLRGRRWFPVARRPRAGWGRTSCPWHPPPPSRFRAARF